MDGPESLLTPKSLSLSLAPPRAPPSGSSHHRLLRGDNPSNKNVFLAQHHHDYAHQEGRLQPATSSARTSKASNKKHRRVQKILEEIYLKQRRHSSRKSAISHPHLPSGSEVKSTRFLFGGNVLPLWWQNGGRDNGTFRSICDNLITCTTPAYALSNPKAAMDFLHLSSAEKKIVVPYHGAFHERQKMDLFLPDGFDYDQKKVRGLVFFVHGGAWGSGETWMYRLIANSFLPKGMAVAVIGYRTYPDGYVDDQVQDLEMAAETLALEYPHLLERQTKNTKTTSETLSTLENFKDNKKDDWLGLCLMGHSSGAHLALLLLVHRLEQKIQQQKQNNEQTTNLKQRRQQQRPTIHFDSYIGLAGVYNISNHFDYEANRGVEEISPLKPACGSTRQAFHHFSPHFRLRQLLHIEGEEMDIQLMQKQQQDQQHNDRDDPTLADLIPRSLFVHGIEDDTVPFTSTTDAVYTIRSCGVRNCSEYYLPRTGHVQVVLQLMEGGKTRDLVNQWLEEGVNNDVSSTTFGSSKCLVGLRSKL